MNSVPSAMIAIVDDEAPVRKALLRLFRAAGFEARAFASGQEFLESLPYCQYDCLVLDLHMPGMTGLEVQQDKDFCKIKVPTVIITAHDELETRQKCLSAGVTAYLCKPFDDNALLKAIERAIS